MSYHDVSPPSTDPQTPWQEEDEDGNTGPEPSLVSDSELHILSDEESELDGAPRDPLSLPIWLREQSKGFHFGWVPLPIRRTARAVNEWTKGPDEPQIQRIHPWFPMVQEAPIWAVRRFLPQVWQKTAALSFLLGLWLLIFCLLFNAQEQSGQVEDYGHPQGIWCGARFWDGGCGIDGNDCRPFEGGPPTAFKCPANCLSTKQLQAHTVGTQELQWTQQVIGGPENDTENAYYRADSFICHAAIHAGILSDEHGGCGVVELSGPRHSFTASESNKISSLGFDALFPKSFTFHKDVSSSCEGIDMRWSLLGVTLSFTIIVSLVVWEPWLLFPIIFTMLFFHVGMVSDRPNITDVPSLFSVIIKRFLPGALSVFVLYKVAVKPQLTGLTAQVEKTILWLGGAWIGSLSNYTFEWIPVSRLTPGDLKQPGAVLSITLIVLVIFTIALGQIWYLRLEKRLRTYLAIYGAMGAALIIGVLLPQLNLRIHHYILALLLVPGTRTQTRPALFYQGLLLGLFINGIARWDFDSVLQTPNDLHPGHGGDELHLLPNITTPLAFASNITFNWASPPQGYDGISILVNDVERKRVYLGEGSPTMTWHRKWNEGGGAGEKAYFRFGYMQGSGSSVYTKAGVWEEDGSWTSMKPGKSTTE